MSLDGENLTSEMAELKHKSNPDALLKKLGERIVYLRKKAGKSQNDLAYEIEWDKPNLRKIEKGKTNPTFKTLVKLADALEVTVRDLLKGIE